MLLSNSIYSQNLIDSVKFIYEPKGNIIKNSRNYLLIDMQFISDSTIYIPLDIITTHPDNAGQEKVDISKYKVESFPQLIKQLKYNHFIVENQKGEIKKFYEYCPDEPFPYIETFGWVVVGETTKQRDTLEADIFYLKIQSNCFKINKNDKRVRMHYIFVGQSRSSHKAS